MELYPLLKWLHILSATVLFGTGLGTAFSLWRTHRSGNIAALVVVTRNAVLADWLFTTPAVVLQALTGFWLVHLLGYPLNTSWIVAALILYLMTGACWLPVVWLQLQLRDLVAAALAEGKDLPPHYHRYMKYWSILGWPAFGAVLAIFYLMVFKPALW